MAFLNCDQLNYELLSITHLPHATTLND